MSTTCPGPTFTEIGFVVTEPGFGLLTARGNVPGFGAGIDATSCVEETKVVGTAAPFHMICAPYTNCEPLTVTMVVPSEKPVGVTEVKAGIGFNTPIATAPGGSLGNLAVVVVIATVFGTGTIAGAVYKPLLSIVPNSAFPPWTPLTKKMTGTPVVLALSFSCIC